MLNVTFSRNNHTPNVRTPLINISAAHIKPVLKPILSTKLTSFSWPIALNGQIHTKYCKNVCVGESKRSFGT